MINKKISDLKPKIWRTLLIWGLITYCIQIIATATGEILRGYTDKYTIMSWLANLSVPSIAFLIGLVLSKWRQPQNRIQFAAIFTICTFLLCLIGQVLLSYAIDAWGPWDMNVRYIMPSIVAIVLQTLISTLLITYHNKSRQITGTRLYIIVLSIVVLATQAMQTIQLIPSVVNFSIHANTWHTFVLPVVMWLWLVVPTILFAMLIIINTISLKTTKNTSQRLFLACLTSTYIFIIISALLITVGVTPLHDILNFWICVAIYSVALIIDGVIIHRLRKLSVS